MKQVINSGRYGDEIDLSLPIRSNLEQILGIGFVLCRMLGAFMAKICAMLYKISQ